MLWLMNSTFSPSTRPGQLARINGKVLVACVLCGDWTELPEPTCAAKLDAARTDAAHLFRLVPDADLTQLYAGSICGSEVLDQLTEIDPMIGGEIEGYLVAVELDFASTSFISMPRNST